MFSFNNEVMDSIKDKASIEDIVGPELNGVINRNLWQETIDIQIGFNDGVAPGWKESPKYDYWMAILDETVEVLGSKHWKWWKDSDNFGAIDWNNIEVELIDLFLFILSIAIKENSEEVIYVTLASAQMAHENPEIQTPIRDEKFFDDFWEQFLTGVSLKVLPLVVVKWVEFWFRSGGTIEKLLMQFRVKAALNNIRQEFGYGTGKYRKIWNGVEDNVIAWKLSENITLDENTTDILTESLRGYYLSKVAV